MVHTFIIEPNTYNAFENEDEQIDKCKDWGLLSEKASKTKVFYYKGKGMNLPCSIVGYVDQMTAVIEFDNKQQHCIHPSYLKEMQVANYALRTAITTDDTSESGSVELESQQVDALTSEAPIVESKAEAPIVDKPKEAEAKVVVAKAEAPQSAEPAKAKSTRKAKIELPEEKVKMIATVQEFTTVPNHFADTDDEVVIYEAVFMTDPETELGSAWSSHSATLKKMELAVGDTITFEAKVAAKKLTKHPVPYKINNPSKIQKQTP